MFPRKADHHEPVESLRLIAAADHLVRVTMTQSSREPNVSAWAGDLSRMPRGSFTVDELVEAMLFLRRLGIEIPGRGAAIGRDLKR